MIGRSIVSAWTLLAAILLQGGCDSIDPEPGHCRTDLDCQGQALCLTSTSECLPLAFAESWSLALTPPENNQGWVPFEVTLSNDTAGSASIEWDERGRWQIDAPPSVFVAGQLLRSDQADVVQGTLRVRRTSLLSGLAPVDFLTAAAPRAGEEQPPSEEPEEVPTEYGVWLTSGATYQVTARAEPSLRSLLPPRDVQWTDIDVDSRENITFEGPDRTFTLQGRILDATGQPLPYSVLVYVVDTAGRERSPRGLTCSRADRQYCSCETGSFTSCLGTFRLRMPPGLARYTIIVDSAVADPNADLTAPATSTTLVPRIVCPELLLGIIDENNEHIIGDSLRLPSFGGARSFTQHATDATEEPLPGIRITAELQTPLSFPDSLAPFWQSCSASFSRTSVSASNGRASLSLLFSDDEPFTYGITLMPPPKDPHTRFQIDTPIESSTTELQPVLLPEKTQVALTLQTTAEAAVRGASILVVRQRTEESALDLGDESQALSDSEGLVTLAVTPGQYDLYVTFPESSNLPPFRLTGVDLLSLPEGSILRLPDPQILKGRLISGTEAAAHLFSIRIYQPTAEGSLTEITTAATDDEGWFEAVVPDPATPPQWLFP